MINKKNITEIVRKQVLKILNYLEYIYVYNIDNEKELEEFKEILEKTNLERMYLEPKVHYTKENYSYIELETSDIYLCFRDLRSDYLEEKIINLCITQFLKDAIKTIKQDKLSKKTIVLYLLLSDLKIIDNRYLGICFETQLIADYISNKIINY